MTTDPIKLAAATKFVDPNRVIVVGVDEDANDSNHEFYEPYIGERALHTNALYNAAPLNIQSEWDALVESIQSKGVLVPVMLQEVMDGDTQKLYVVYGRRRVLALREANAKDSLNRQIPYVLKPKAVSAETAMRIENSARLNLTEGQQVRTVMTLLAQHVPKKDIAAQIGVSVNHVDVLFRIGSSVPELTQFLGNTDYKDSFKLIMSEIKKLADFHEDPKIQREIVLFYMRIKALNFCESRALGASKVALEFCQNIKTLSKLADGTVDYAVGFEVVKADWLEKIKSYIGDTADDTEIPTIDSFPESRSSESNTPAQTTESVPADPVTESVAPKKAEPDATPASRVVQTATKPNRKQLDDFLDDDPAKFGDDAETGPWIAGLPRTAQETLRWVHLGILPTERRDQRRTNPATGSKYKDDNTGLCDYIVACFPTHAKHLQDPDKVKPEPAKDSTTKSGKGKK